ncbi:MAG: hypothetical protein RXQ99_00145 [Acidianus sp.]|uniref:hypothetical protein n=1 Tax=Acidianus sp. TaxID=1872104 RepID=UPI00397DD417
MIFLPVFAIYILIKLPPLNGPSIYKLNMCEDRKCVEEVVDDYLKSLIRPQSTNEKFKLFQDNEEEDEEIDEKTVANSYLFTEILIKRILNADLDLDFIFEDLKSKLGNSHPIVIFLKELLEE